jgi:hypothetical protein
VRAIEPTFRPAIGVARDVSNAWDSGRPCSRTPRIMPRTAGPSRHGRLDSTQSGYAQGRGRSSPSSHSKLERDESLRPGPTTVKQRRINELGREVRELPKIFQSGVSTHSSRRLTIPRN